MMKTESEAVPAGHQGFKRRYEAATGDITQELPFPDHVGQCLRGVLRFLLLMKLCRHMHATFNTTSIKKYLLLLRTS